MILLVIKFLNKGCKHISVIDNGAFNPRFVEQKAKEIVDLINKDF
jgi:hypothetical protein